MASPKKPTILLIHGIWHSPLTYTKLTSALTSAGYEVHAPYLPSCSGARPPIASLDTDTQVVRRLAEILCDQGKTLIVLAHSYGGTVAGNALEGLDIDSRSARGLKGGVAHLIGLAAHIHPKDFCILDFIRDMGDEKLLPMAVPVDEDGTCFSAAPREMLFAGMPDAEVEAAIITLSRANFNVFEMTIRAEAWKAIPVTYVHCTEDMTLPPHYQARIVEKMREASVDVKVVEMKTGHSPYSTMTDDVVQLVEQTAESLRVL